MKMESNPSNSQPITLISLIKPIIKVNQLIGICPHEISSGNILVFRANSFKFFHTLGTLTVLSLYVMFLCAQFFLSFRKHHSLPEKAYLVLWILGTLLPISMTIATIIKRHRFTLFFEKMHEYKQPLKGLINCEKTLQYSRKLTGFYTLMAIAACCFVSNGVVNHPKNDCSILAYMDGEPTELQIFLACCFQCYLVLLLGCAVAFIEVFCSSLANCFSNMIVSVVKELDEAPMNGDRNTKKTQIHPHVKNIYNNGQVSPEEELYPKIMQHNEFSGISQCPAVVPLPLPMEVYGSLYKNSSSLGEHDSAGIMLAIKRYNCIASMQRLINCIFGMLLAIDTAFLVFMSCLMLYLQINFMGTGGDEFNALKFTGHGIPFFTRTVLLFVNLSAVYDKAICFNGVLTSALMQARNPDPMDVNLILAHLSTHSASPMAYSAGGFFTFTKSSLLAVLSGVMTYVVFLLQVKN